MASKIMWLKKILIFSFALCALRSAPAYAFSLDKIKACFLSEDYRGAIAEGEKILAGQHDRRNLDELYYILGLSYLKEVNYLRASDIFEIILKEFPESRFQAEARLGLADAYFLKHDFGRAQNYYKQILEGSPPDRLKAQVYYRLSRAYFEQGDPLLGEQYLAELKKEFPATQELLNDCLAPGSAVYYTVQVGAFSKKANANNLKRQLIEKGYPAYVEESGPPGLVSYRVRVGKSAQHKEIKELESRLAKEGYPTKILP